MTPLDMPGQAARIDWARGRVVGFSVPEGGQAVDVVTLALDGRVVVTAVANRSVFEMAAELAGLPLPSKEACGFELRIPQGSLLPAQLAQSQVQLTVRGRSGAPLLEQSLRGPQELLQLVEGAPVDLLFDVQFRGVRDGVLHGVVLDRHGAGRKPILRCRLNAGVSEPLRLNDSSADGRAHFFSWALPLAQLSEGRNELWVTGQEGQPLACYPIKLGQEGDSELAQRVVALEAQVAFLSRLALSQPNEALPAKMAMLKSEIVDICSEMLAMQRANFEREALAAIDMAMSAGQAPVARTRAGA